MQEQNKTKLNRNSVGKEKKKKKLREGEQPHYCRSTTNLYPANAMGGGPTIKGFIEGVVWWRGEKGLISIFD